MRTAIWKKGKRTLKGRWEYVWASHCFVIALDSRDPVTGKQRVFRVSDDHPEWDGWKIVKENGKKKETAA